MKGERDSNSEQHIMNYDFWNIYMWGMNGVV